MYKLLNKFSAITLAMGILALGISTAAHADECSDTLSMIEDASQSATLAPDDAETVAAAKAEAMDKHAAGDINGCLASLVDAKQMLNLN